jgi:hypothetical protein
MPVRSTIPPSRRRTFRVVAVFVIPALLLLVAELALRLCGAGYPTSFFLRANLNGETMLTEIAGSAGAFSIAKPRVRRAQ